MLLSRAFTNAMFSEDWVATRVLGAFHGALSSNVSALVLAFWGFAHEWPVLFVKVGRLPSHGIEVFLSYSHWLSSITPIAALVIELFCNRILVDEVPILGCDLHIGLSGQPTLLFYRATIVEVNLLQEKVHVIKNALGRLSKTLKWLLKMHDFAALSH